MHLCKSVPPTHTITTHPIGGNILLQKALGGRHHGLHHHHHHPSPPLFPLTLLAAISYSRKRSAAATTASTTDAGVQPGEQLAALTTAFSLMAESARLTAVGRLRAVQHGWEERGLT